MHERLIKKSVKVVKAKSAKVQGARAYAREKERILEMLRGRTFFCVGKNFPTPFELLSDAMILRRKIYAKTIA